MADDCGWLSATPLLVAYLAIAADVAKITRDLAEEATARYRANPIELSLRDEVLTGLLLKIDSSFRALVTDARVPRSEAMHHLKTMVESFIYVYVVGADMSDGTAESVRMESVYRKLILLRDDPSPDVDEIATWSAILDEYKQANIRPIGTTRLDRLAKAHGVGDWYARVYRLACEPAHLGDLWEFMPDPPGQIHVGPSRHAASRAQAAVYYGLLVMFAALEAVNTMNVLALHVDVEPLRRRLGEA
jgi:hypothetical protein